MRRASILSLTLAASLHAFAGTGKVVIVSIDRPGVGFNDTTPVQPVGGNPGTTLGEQRMNVFNAAAATWSAYLDTNVDIIAQAQFTPIPPCTADSAVLGQASPWSWRRDFTNAPQPNVWYPIALANKLAGRDLEPGTADIFAQFNSSLDDANCLGASNWYYGLDGQHGIHNDLYLVVLHELAHGLGISGNGRSPFFRDNIPAVSDLHTLDLTTGRRWDQMSEGERTASMTNTGKLVWDGETVRRNAYQYLEPAAKLTISEPANVAREYRFGTAAFGPTPSGVSVSGNVAAAVDASTTDSPSTRDGCTAFSNAAAISGNIALVDRGSCLFTIKAQNAQAAGATAIIIVDNVASACEQPPGMAGEAPDVTIPVISVTQNDGARLRAELNANNTVRGRLGRDTVDLAGTAQGYVRLYAPCVVEPGSSTHHWDDVSTPNLLMEPSINSDLLHGLDLTVYQLLDIGWTRNPRSGRRIFTR
jgi:hypothetical protein